MNRIKHFQCNNYQIEEIINKWLINNQNIIILNTSQSSHPTMSSIDYIIIYQEIEPTKQIL